MMRILVVSNLYPPGSLGGYELGCADIVRGLEQQGHEIEVLTCSGDHDPAVPAEASIHRTLRLRGGTLPGRLSLLGLEAHNQRATLRVLRSRSFQAALVFSLWRVSHSLLSILASAFPRTLAYAFSSEWIDPDFANDPWFCFWNTLPESPARRSSKALVRALTSPFLETRPPRTIPFERAFFTSRRLRERFVARGFASDSGEVVYWGVDPHLFSPPPIPRAGQELRLLFAGRLVREKGLHTVVEALQGLAAHGPARALRLTVAGPDQDEHYASSLRHEVEASSLRDRVRFLGHVPRDAMPDLYREHDVYVLPSCWEEPFSIGLIEAMASGMAVVATSIGGTPEAVEPGRDGLLFPPESSSILATHLRALAGDHRLVESLGRAARLTVERRFTLQEMVRRIDTWLTALCRDATQSEG